MTSASARYNGGIRERSSRTCSFADFLASHAAEEQLYLAQASLRGDDPLAALHADIKLPDCLLQRDVQDVNLWMSTRSGTCFVSTHPARPLA